MARYSGTCLITMALGKVKQESHELEASLDYIKKQCLKKNKVL
jgi:hypothetical protein